MMSGKVDPETSSLSDVYKTFVKTVEELEKSLMFPSMLTDIPVEYPDEVRLISGSITDCKDLFLVLKSIKNSVLFDLKKNWFAGVECGGDLAANELASKVATVAHALHEASMLANLLKQKYNSTVERDDLLMRQDSTSDDESIDRIERVVKGNQDFDVVTSDFQKKVFELESIILIPSLLRDDSASDIKLLLSDSSLGLQENTDLMEILEFLKVLRDTIFLSPNQQYGTFPNSNCEHLSKSIQELHSTFATLVQLSLSVMQTYQNELSSRSTGTIGNVWNMSLNKLRSFATAEEFGPFRPLYLFEFDNGLL